MIHNMNLNIKVMESRLSNNSLNFKIDFWLSGDNFYLDDRLTFL